MIIRLSTDKMDFENGIPKVHYKHKMLTMLDEFPSLGKLEIMQESLAFIAGYGIKCYLICQDLNQLKSRETGYTRMKPLRPAAMCRTLIRLTGSRRRNTCPS